VQFPPNPAAIARSALAAVNAGVDNLPTRSTDAKEVKADGRKRRWEQHRQARRTELVDGTIAAVGELGSEVGMDEIARHMGISKTVLYRYFSDKNDLTHAVMLRFIETQLVPKLAGALAGIEDEYAMTRGSIEVCVQTIADQPALYSFAMSIATAKQQQALSDSTNVIGQMLAHVMTVRMREREIDLGGVGVFSRMLVGGIQTTLDWWMVERTVSAEELIDYLTMMVWSAIVGIAQADGSIAKFTADIPPLPEH
jgi:AcrR family transcriptional regulator